MLSRFFLIALSVAETLGTSVSPKTCTTESIVNFSDLSAIPEVPTSDLNTVPSPYHNLSYSLRFGVSAMGLTIDPNPQELIYYAITTEPRGTPSISSTYVGSPVLLFYPRSFLFACAIITEQDDVSMPESCTVQLNGTTVAGAPVSATCKYAAETATLDVCNVPGDFSAVTNISFATVSPGVVTDAFATAFAEFDFLLQEAC